MMLVPGIKIIVILPLLTSPPEGIQSDSAALGMTFNELPQNGDLNGEGNNDTS